MFFLSLVTECLSLFSSSHYGQLETVLSSTDASLKLFEDSFRPGRRELWALLRASYSLHQRHSSAVIATSFMSGQIISST